MSLNEFRVDFETVVGEDFEFASDGGRAPREVKEDYDKEDTVRNQQWSHSHQSKYSCNYNASFTPTCAGVEIHACSRKYYSIVHMLHPIFVRAWTKKSTNPRTRTLVCTKHNSVLSSLVF